MFATLLQSGSYRVDYFKDQVAGTPQELSFYACGEIPSQAAYCQTGKHNLLAGLVVIQHHFGISNLVAVYLDVHAPQQTARPAYERMKHDLRARLFKSTFVFCACTLMDGLDILKDLSRLYGEIDGFELITFENGACKTLPPIDEAVLDLVSPVLAQ